MAARISCFGAVGRLTPVKDHRTLLEAFHAVAGRRPQSRLIFVGDGSERPVLEEQARRFGLEDRVRLVGFRGDVTQWLGMMDVFVHPSLMEGMSNAVLEADGGRVARRRHGGRRNSRNRRARGHGISRPPRRERRSTTR